MAISTPIKRVRQWLIRLPESRPVLSWILALLGGGIICLACFGFFCIYAALDLRYLLADSPDEYPDHFDWSIYTFLSLIFAAMFLSGCYLIWSRLRKFITAV